MNPTTNGYRCKFRVSMLSKDQQNLGVKSFLANSRLKRTVAPLCRLGTHEESLKTEFSLTEICQKYRPLNTDFNASTDTRCGPSIFFPPFSPTLLEMKRLTRMLFSPDFSAMGTSVLPHWSVGWKNNFGR